MHSTRHTHTRTLINPRSFSWFPKCILIVKCRQFTCKRYIKRLLKKRFTERLLKKIHWQPSGIGSQIHHNLRVAVHIFVCLSCAFLFAYFICLLEICMKSFGFSVVKCATICFNNHLLCNVFERNICRCDVHSMRYYILLKWCYLKNAWHRVKCHIFLVLFPSRLRSQCALSLSLLYLALLLFFRFTSLIKVEQDDVKNFPMLIHEVNILHIHNENGICFLRYIHPCTYISERMQNLIVEICITWVGGVLCSGCFWW